VSIEKENGEDIPSVQLLKELFVVRRRRRRKGKRKWGGDGRERALKDTTVLQAESSAVKK